MILCLIENTAESAVLLQGAYQLSKAWKKKFGVQLINVSSTEIDKEKAYLEKYIKEQVLSIDYLQVSSCKLSTLQTICDENDVAVLIIQLGNTKRFTIMSYLKACRQLRIPYMFIKNELTSFKFDKLILPVNFLVEEVGKAQFAAAFGRFCDTKIRILQAKDYGSKAAENVATISSVLDSFDLKYTLAKGKKDSFKIDKEAMQYANRKFYDLLLVSASREYGLDDIVFGPKEYHLIRKTKSALMLINPRADLYVLCN